MKRNLIYDVGLHLGEDSEFYLKKGFDVVAVEASPDNAAKAANRLKAYVDSGRLTIVNKAINRDEAPVAFFVSDRSIWGTTDPSTASRNRHLGSSIREIAVPGVPFGRLLQQYGVPYYMKVDIEGADTLCLEGLMASADRPKYVSIESTKASFDDLVAEFSLLQRLGYRKYKVVAQHRIEEQRLPKTAREGQFVDHVFEEGSSGAFGRELPGEWMSLEQALKVYMRIFRKYRIVGDYGWLSSFSVIREALNRRRDRRDRQVASAAPRKTLPRRLLRNIEARLRPGWYDTHAMLQE
jgi:FkbM family methyltransferase